MLWCLVCVLSVAASQELGEDEKPSSWVPHSSPGGGSLSSVLWHGERGFWVEEGNSVSKHKVGLASYSNEVNTTGWAFLELQTKAGVPDKIQSYGAGYLEGWVTSSLLYMQYQNTIVGRCDGKQPLCEKMQHWVESNDRWIHKKVRHHSSHTPYWHQVGLFYSQMAGLHAGYKARVRGTEMDLVTYTDILTMNIFGDLEDLEGAFSTPQTWIPPKVRGLGRCSALLRLLPDNSELLVSHDTWNSYQSMLRIIKSYNMPFLTHRGGEVVPGRELSFSGSPGVIYSGDDFTVTNSGLTILETTIGNSNPALWKHLTPHSVLEGVRSMVATRLATDGDSWTEVFSHHNSGTYNNQWMVVDYKLFVPGQEIQLPGLLWVLEQIPGYTKREDLTEVLRKRTFWPSYNSPYFPDVFNMSGNFELVEKFGDWFSYERTPRARIFARDAPLVENMEDMIKLMRYNNYTEDPLSACNCTPPYSAENGISARCDLNPKNGSYPFGALGHRSHGGTDMKVTSSSLARSMQFIAQSGPTWDPLPPFQWSLQDFQDTPHVGHPDLWQFQALHHSWSLDPAQFGNIANVRVRNGVPTPVLPTV